MAALGAPNNYVPRRILKKLQRSRTDSEPYQDLRNKLQILAVKSRTKPAFLGFPAGNTGLRQLGALLDLHQKVTAAPPPHFTKRPDVKDSFLKASMDVLCPKDPVLWLYSDIGVESLISRCIDGVLNEGYVLGYPRCCVEWHEAMRVPEMESCFRQIEERITTDPQMLKSIPARTEMETYRFILLHWRVPYPDYALETTRQYPFAPHWACPSCLSRESNESEKLNNQYNELATNFDPKFAQAIERAASDSLRAYKESWTEESKKPNPSMDLLGNPLDTE